MNLPRSLAPWASQLQIFPAETIDALAPLIHRIAAALGPLRIKTEQGQGDPDGFDGIGRRGPYERLLISEWLIADEVPDEFARRAAMGEHAFLQLAYAEPSGGRASLVLFDAGPSQWGTPRIGHLAALIVLAQRAEAAGSEFIWDIAQLRQVNAFTSLTEASVVNLLTARSPYEIAEEYLTEWRENLTTQYASNDIWLVGGRRVAAMAVAQGFSMLQLSDVFDPEVRRIAMHVAAMGRPKRELELDLPDNANCSRLLRDPFAVLKSKPQRTNRRFAPASNLVFANRSFLLARSRNGDILSYALPNGPHGNVGKPKIYKPGFSEPMIAAGRINKTFVGITFSKDRDKASIVHLGGKGTGVKYGDYLAQKSEKSTQTDYGFVPPLHPICMYTHDNGGQITIDQFGTLAQLHWDDQGRHLTFQETDVAALGGDGSPESPIVYVFRDPHRWIVHSFVTGVELRSVSVSNELTDTVFIGYGGHLADPNFGLVAVPDRSGHWTVHSRLGNQPYHLNGGQVVGVTTRSTSGTPGLVIKEDKRILSIVGLDWSHQLPPAPADIDMVTASPYAPHIAYSTVNGDVLVYSLTHETLIYQLMMEATP